MATTIPRFVGFLAWLKVLTHPQAEEKHSRQKYAHFYANKVYKDIQAQNY